MHRKRFFDGVAQQGGVMSPTVAQQREFFPEFAFRFAGPIRYTLRKRSKVQTVWLTRSFRDF